LHQKADEIAKYIAKFPDVQAKDDDDDNAPNDTFG